MTLIAYVISTKVGSDKKLYIIIENEEDAN